MESCYIPNNPQFGISLEYTSFNGAFSGYGHVTPCDTGQDHQDPELQQCACSQNLHLPGEYRDCECADSCDRNLNEFNDELDCSAVLGDEGGFSEENNDLGCEQGDTAEAASAVGAAFWSGEDMGSFSLPALDLEPLPGLFPFPQCAGSYSRGGGSGGAGDCRERGGSGAEAADVLLSLKHAAVHAECGGDAQHAQVLVSPPSGGYPYYEQYAPPPLFPTMSVNVSMNMTMHGYPPDQMCPQWSQNNSPPMAVVYPQPPALLSPAGYPSATYSFTADFRGPEPLPAPAFKPLPAQGKPAAQHSYPLFQKQQAFAGVSHKSMSTGGAPAAVVGLRRGGGCTQAQHIPDYSYPGCGVTGKVQVGALSGCSEEDDQKPNLCRICGKTYARPSTLKTHLRTHSGERPYRCADCNKSFSQAANLTAHVRTHTGQKPFRCPICDRRFSQSSSVTTHMRTHSGERPYRCRACKKAFSDSSTLTKHLRIHSGEKPYQCKLCLLRFSQSGNLNRHMRVHGNSAALLG